MHNCFVIPIYNHHDTIATTVEALLPYQLPIIIADDGSDSQTKQALQQLASRYTLVDIVTLARNGGKGAAVSAALRRAAARSFSHALQIDADAQHDVNDIPAFWQLAAQHPDDLISGAPLYDEYMPRSRRIGRHITHFWVNIETLSRDIRDSMLGYRVYPVAASIRLIDQVQLGQRMDFDIEIMVRLYWQGIKVRFIPTRVIYPQGGRSHFSLLQDNWLISKMHTKLFFGMLWRMPLLLKRKWTHG